MIFSIFAIKSLRESILKWYFTKGHVSVKMYLLQKCYRKITNMEL